MNDLSDTIGEWAEIYNVSRKVAETLIIRVMHDFDHPVGLCSEKCFDCLNFDQSLIGYACYWDFEDCDQHYMPIGGE